MVSKKRGNLPKSNQFKNQNTRVAPMKKWRSGSPIKKSAKRELSLNLSMNLILNPKINQKNHAAISLKIRLI